MEDNDGAWRQIAQHRGTGRDALELVWPSFCTHFPAVSPFVTFLYACITLVLLILNNVHFGSCLLSLHTSSSHSLLIVLPVLSLSPKSLSQESNQQTTHMVQPCDEEGGTRGEKSVSLLGKYQAIEVGQTYRKKMHVGEKCMAIAGLRKDDVSHVTQELHRGKNWSSVPATQDDGTSQRRSQRSDSLEQLVLKSFHSARNLIIISCKWCLHAERIVQNALKLLSDNKTSHLCLYIEHVSEWNMNIYLHTGSD